MGITKGSGGGEIVQVQGGHIVRSTGRKDRHSKVYTSKGPRDRRVRLSAHTAILFYDVQDRLGFDRPSKAVDWLIKKAKSSIDKLADPPPWNPTSASIAGPTAASTSTSGKTPVPEQPEVAEVYTTAGSSLMPPQPQLEDSDSMKLFFPTSNVAPSSSITFTGCSIPPEMVARAAQQREDLALSLHPFQDSSGCLHSASSRALFIGTTTDAFGPAGCSNYPKMMGWGGDPGMEENRGAVGHGFLMSQGGSSALMMVNPQRGPLQSSFTGSFDELTTGPTPSDNHHPKPPMVAVHQPSFFGGRFGPDSLTGVYFPARIHGGSGSEEHAGIVSDRHRPLLLPTSGNH